MGQLLATVDSLEQQVPRETFSPESIVAKVGKEPAALAGWVRSSTSWVPYRGALRGPVGVLMDRSGSSLDRSWLLAELLRIAGHKARLARATLAAADAASQLAAIGPAAGAPPSRPAPRSVQADMEAAARYAEAHQIDAGSVREHVRVMSQRSERLGSELRRRVESQAPFLSQSVGVVKFVDQRERETLAAIADHWWVQVQQGPNQWADLDIAVPVGSAPAAPRVPAQTIPLDARGRVNLTGRDWHRVVIRARVEQWRAGRLVETTALEHAFHPAEVAGQPIVLQHMAIDAPLRTAVPLVQTAMQDLKTAVLAQHEWLPYLTVGDRNVWQSSFKDDGTLNRRPALGQGGGGPGGLGAAGMFGGLFGGEGEATPAPGGVLTAEWIEYEVQVPGSAPTKVRREVFDLLGSAGRRAPASAGPEVGDPQRLRRAAGLLGMTQIMAMAGRLSPEYVQLQALRELARNRGGISGIAAGIATANPNAILAESAKLRPTQTALFDLALARFEWSPVAEDVYLAAPNLLAYQTAIVPDEGGGLAMQHGYDILVNQVGVRPRATVQPFAARVAQGTADTNAEGILLGGGGVVNAGVFSAGVAPSAWVTVRTPADLAKGDAGWSPEIRARIEGDLRAGFVVVAPRGEKASSPGAFAWWRIDPRSGTTLGMGASGWGQGSTERVTLDVMVKAVAAFVVSFSLTFTTCAIRNGVLSNTYTSDMAERVAIMKSCGCAGLAGGAAFAGAVVSGWAAWVTGMAIASATKEALCG